MHDAKKRTRQAVGSLIWRAEETMGRRRLRDDGKKGLTDTQLQCACTTPQACSNPSDLPAMLLERREARRATFLFEGIGLWTADGRRCIVKYSLYPIPLAWTLEGQKHKGGRLFSYLFINTQKSSVPEINTAICWKIKREQISNEEIDNNDEFPTGNNLKGGKMRVKDSFSCRVQFSATYIHFARLQHFLTRLGRG